MDARLRTPLEVPVIYGRRGADCQVRVRSGLRKRDCLTFFSRLSALRYAHQFFASRHLVLAGLAITRNPIDIAPKNDEISSRKILFPELFGRIFDGFWKPIPTQGGYC